MNVAVPLSLSGFEPIEAGGRGSSPDGIAISTSVDPFVSVFEFGLACGAWFSSVSLFVGSAKKYSRTQTSAVASSQRLRPVNTAVDIVVRMIAVAASLRRVGRRLRGGLSVSVG